MQRRAKVFMNNRSQAVRLPKESQFNTDEVFIRKEGEDVILSPRPADWGPYLEGGPVASEAFMEHVEDLPYRSVSPTARYMLDTDTRSYIMKRSNQVVLQRLQAIAVSDVCMSAITKVRAALWCRDLATPGTRCDGTAGIPSPCRGAPVSQRCRGPLRPDTRGVEETRPADSEPTISSLPPTHAASGSG